MALTGSYLDVDGFKSRTIATAALVDGTHIPPSLTAERAAWTAFVQSRLVIETSKINARLAKRYAVPFATPPEIVLGWLTAKVTVKLYQRRGWDVSDAQAQEIIDDAKEADTEIKEAADAENGLFDLPLREDQSPETSAIALDRAGPLAYSEASPYDWIDAQTEALRG